jgi:hypothetical protein
VAGAGGAVSSVFGRGGAVTAQTGDYSFGQISGSVGSSQLPGAGRRCRRPGLLPIRFGFAPTRLLFALVGIEREVDASTRLETANLGRNADGRSHASF